jgi:hypothetical protein
MKLTKSQLQQIIKEELEEIGIEGGDPVVGKLGANVITSFMGAARALKNEESFSYPIDAGLFAELSGLADQQGLLGGVNPKILLGIGIAIGILILVGLALGYNVKVGGGYKGAQGEIIFTAPGE